jgi:hypothetical protein
MKTKPILFKSEMVKSILEGTKTQTRRIMKVQPVKKGAFWELGAAGWSMDQVTPVYGHSLYNKIPYQPETILWVRETWSLYGWDLEEGTVTIRYKDGTTRNLYPNFQGVDEWVIRKIDKLEDGGYIEKDPLDPEMYLLNKIRWEPSIFMPKWACRIWVKVNHSKAERLLEISEEDAIAEGVICHEKEESYHDYMNPEGGCFVNAKGSFYTLWESINGKDSLLANPWVWVYTFQICEMPKDFLL